MTIEAVGAKWRRNDPIEKRRLIHRDVWVKDPQQSITAGRPNGTFIFLDAFDSRIFGVRRRDRFDGRHGQGD
jgi:hypothetical protein